MTYNSLDAIHDAVEGDPSVCDRIGHTYVTELGDDYTPVCADCGHTGDADDATPLTWDGLPLDAAVALNGYEAGR